jgi:PKD repeat protein
MSYTSRLAGLILSFAFAACAFAQTTITLQQGVNNYNGLTDSWITASVPTQNRGTDGALSIREEVTDAGMVRFKIFAAEGGPVPNGATITSATLSLYKFQGPDVVLKASRLLKNWDELQVTWNTAATGTPWTTPGALSAGNDYVATPDGQASIGAAAASCDATAAGPFPPECWLHIDVTTGVQAFAANPATNFGWKLAEASSSLPGNYKNFQSRDHPSFPSTWPQLTVTYTTTPPPSGTTTLLQQGVNGYTGLTDSWIISAIPTQNRGTDGGLSLRSESTDSAMVRFKIFAAEGGPVPNGATITSATLSLYKFQGPDAVIKASRLLKNWDEMQVTWNIAAAGVPWTTPGALSAGNDYLATADGQASVADALANNCDATAQGPFPAACWLRIDVTSGVQAFAANPAINFGWKIAQVSSSLPDNYKNLQSRDHPSFPSTWPQLSVTWTTGAPPPTAQLTANPTSGQPPLNVTFNASGTTDNGSPITGLRLSFGDGTPDATWTDKNVTQSHTYSAAGTYTASLTATNANGTSAPATRTITVGPVGPTAAFTATPQTGTEPLMVMFNASGSTQGSSAISSLRLQFGHNAQEVIWTDKNVAKSYTYPAGAFTATLTVTDASGLTSSTTRPINVTPTGPTTDCTRSGLSMCIDFEAAETQFEKVDFNFDCIDPDCSEIRTESVGGAVRWFAQNAASDRAAPANNGNRVSLVDGGREGSGKAIKLTTLDNDSGVHNSGNSERSELEMDTARTGAVEGAEQWWAHSMLLPADSHLPTALDTGALFLQFHNASGQHDQPHFTLSFINQKGDNPHLIIRATSSGAGGLDASGTQYRYQVPGAGNLLGQCLHDNPVRDVWYDFVHHIKWSSTGQGVHEIWMREGSGAVKKVLDKRNISTLYAGDSGYLKIGAYHDQVLGQNTSVIHDRLRRGASADAVRMSDFVIPSTGVAMCANASLNPGSP